MENIVSVPYRDFYIGVVEKVVDGRGVVWSGRDKIYISPEDRGVATTTMHLAGEKEGALAILAGKEEAYRKPEEGEHIVFQKDHMGDGIFMGFPWVPLDDVLAAEQIAAEP